MSVTRQIARGRDCHYDKQHVRLEWHMDQPVSDDTTDRAAILAKPRMDGGRNARAKIGFVLIPNEQTIEEDMIRHMPEGVGAYFARAPMPREISTESLAQVKGSLAEAAARILPDDGLDVIAFACTSGTVAVGEDVSRRELARGAPQARTSTLAGAVRRALAAVGARRVVLGSPYIPDLNANMVRYLAGAGF